MFEALPLFSFPAAAPSASLSFLQRLQSTALKTLGPTNFDPNLYVDLPLKSDLSTAEAAFDKLPRSPNGSVAACDLGGFIEQHLEGVGRDLVAAKPGDFVPVPEGFLPKVKSKEVRAWALEVHSLWKNLSRKVSDEVKGRPGLHTLLPLHGWVVIPGSRFREVYYWDLYWVISVWGSSRSGGFDFLHQRPRVAVCRCLRRWPPLDLARLSRLHRMACYSMCPQTIQGNPDSRVSSLICCASPNPTHPAVYSHPASTVRFQSGIFSS